MGVIDELTLVKLLDLPFDDACLWRELCASEIRRRELEGIGDDAWIELKDDGISVMFKKDPSSLGHRDAQPNTGFRVVAFHLRRKGLDGHSQFEGRLTGNVEFGDTREQIESKLGTEYEFRAGGASRVIHGKRNPVSLKYFHGEWFAQYQLDDAGRLEMVTLSLTRFM